MSNTVEMTIHAALGELKKLDGRIDRAIYAANFIGYKKASADKVMGTSFNTEDFKKNAEASYQSICDLIERRDIIKSAITLSNATTKVQVGQKEMTVAEAIEKKASIEHRKSLLERMTKQYNDAVLKTNHNNEKMEENLNDQVMSLTDKSDAKQATANLAGFMDAYRASNGWETIDPLGLKAKIDALNEEVEDFENNVDVALSISNATTKIIVRQ